MPDVTRRLSLKPAPPNLGEDKAIECGTDSNFRLCPTYDCFFFVRGLCHIV
jgi:hypothetical protein